MSFTCLKSFAFDQRFERKDAHDLIYCLKHAPEGMDAVAEGFRKERNGKHGAVIQATLTILRNRFARDDKIEGYRKDGPVNFFLDFWISAKACPSLSLMSFDATVVAMHAG